MNWISVKERLPERAENRLFPTVIVYTTTGEVAVGFIDYKGHAFWVLHGDADAAQEYPMSYVTHWIPLPEPPKELVKCHQRRTNNKCSGTE